MGLTPCQPPCVSQAAIGCPPRSSSSLCQGSPKNDKETMRISVYHCQDLVTREPRQQIKSAKSPNSSTAEPTRSVVCRDPNCFCARARLHHQSFIMFQTLLLTTSRSVETH